MLIKVLEHKWVIRFFGIMLILAPFLNIALAISKIQGLPDPWSMRVVSTYISNSSGAFLLLQAASSFIGFLMLKGSTQAWRYTLALLCGHVVLMLSQWQSFKTDRTPLFLIFVDICIFLFISDQLVWKVAAKKSTVTTVSPVPPSKVEAHLPSPSSVTMPSPAVKAVPPKLISSARKRVIIHFDGIGPWAQLKEVSSQGLRMKCLVSDPPDMTSRQMEINLSRELKLKVRFKQREDTDFYFEYVDLSGQEIGRLNQWLRTAS